MSRPPRAAPRSCSCAGWTSGETARITGLPDSPKSIAWSPDGRRIAYVMTVPDEGLSSSARRRPSPRARTGPPPLEMIDAVTYRADGAGYLKPGFDHLFMVDADGGAPRQLTFGAFNDDGPLAWTPDGRSILFSTVRKRRLGARSARQRDLSRSTSSSGTLDRADQRARAPTSAPQSRPTGGRSPISASTTSARAIEQARALCDEPRRQRRARDRRRPRPRHRPARMGARRPLADRQL